MAGAWVLHASRPWLLVMIGCQVIAAVPVRHASTRLMEIVNIVIDIFLKVDMYYRIIFLLSVNSM